MEASKRLQHWRALAIREHEYKSLVWAERNNWGVSLSETLDNIDRLDKSDRLDKRGSK